MVLPPDVEVTLFERNWCAGGKCSGTRLPPSHRIVQNGTHYIFGVYFNSMQMIKEAEAEILDSRFGGMRDLVPRKMIALKHHYQGEWHNWKVSLPTRPAGASFSDPLSYLAPSLEALKQRLIDDGILIDSVDLGDWIDDLDLGDLAQRGVGVIANLGGAVLLDLLNLLIQKATELANSPGDDTLWKLFKKILIVARFAARALMGGSTDIKVVQGRIMVDYMLTIICGIIEDEVLTGKIGDVDAWDWADWMTHHGATVETVDSPLVMAWYDSVAAYENGDISKPRMSAAAVLQTVLPSLIAYEGDFAYQMKSEVGECFVAPVYEALRKRGVKFRFLHELTKIVPDSSGNSIEKLFFRIPRLPGQSDSDSETALGNYKPFEEYTLDDGTVRVYWPPKPKAPFDFVSHVDIDHPLPYRPFGPSRATIERTVGTTGDFHHVVFAMPHTTIPRVASELVSQKSEWKDLVDQLPSVETKSLRLWLRTPFEDFDWDSDPVDKKVPPVLSAYRPLFSTWEDSGQQLELHTWPGDTPKSIATVFGPMKSGSKPPTNQFCEWFHGWLQVYRARRQAKEFLESHAGGLWPGLVDGGGVFKWSELVPLESPPGTIREQWVIANAGALQRYTQATPGSFPAPPAFEGNALQQPECCRRMDAVLARHRESRADRDLRLARRATTSGASSSTFPARRASSRRDERARPSARSPVKATSRPTGEWLSSRAAGRTRSSASPICCSSCWRGVRRPVQRRRHCEEKSRLRSCCRHGQRSTGGTHESSERSKSSPTAKSPTSWCWASRVCPLAIDSRRSHECCRPRAVSPPRSSAVCGRPRTSSLASRHRGPSLPGGSVLRGAAKCVSPMPPCASWHCATLQRTLRPAAASSRTSF